MYFVYFKFILKNIIVKKTCSNMKVYFENIFKLNNPKITFKGKIVEKEKTPH